MKGHKNEYSPKQGKADVYPSKPRACDDKRDAPAMAIDKLAKFRSDPLAHHTMNEAPDARRGEYMVRTVKDPYIFAQEGVGKEDY